MTPERCKELLPVMQAYAEGKQIQVQDAVGEWWNIKTIELDSHAIYRVKPENKPVPLGPEDVKPGAVFRRTHWNTYEWGMVTSVQRSGMMVQIGCNDGVSFLTFEKLSDEFDSRILLPGKSEWQPCYKEVEE